ARARAAGGRSGLRTRHANISDDEAWQWREADTICFKAGGDSRSADRDGFLLGLEEAVKVASPGWVPQFAQGLGFDLADALAGHAVQIANFLEGVAVAIDQPKAHFEDVPFPRAEQGQNVLELLFEHALAGSFGRVLGALVFDEVPHAHVPIIAHRRVERDRLAGHLEQRVDARNRQTHFIGEVFRRGLAPQFLAELILRPPEPGHDLDHVDRNANGARLVGNGAGQRLANPPHRIGGKLIAAAILEFLDPLKQAKITLLNQIEQRLPPVDVFLSDGDHEAQIGFGHVISGLMGAVGGAVQLTEGPIKLRLRPADELFEGEELASFLSEGGLLVAAFAMVSQLLNPPRAGSEFLMSITGYGDHVLKHLLLIKELRKGGLKTSVELLALAQEPSAVATGHGFLQPGV